MTQKIKHKNIFIRPTLANATEPFALDCVRALGCVRTQTIEDGRNLLASQQYLLSLVFVSDKHFIFMFFVLLSIFHLFACSDERRQANASPELMAGFYFHCFFSGISFDDCNTYITCFRTSSKPRIRSSQFGHRVVSIYNIQERICAGANSWTPSLLRKQQLSTSSNAIMQTIMSRRMTQRTMENCMDFNRLMFENKEEHVTRDPERKCPTAYKK